MAANTDTFARPGGFVKYMEDVKVSTDVKAFEAGDVVGKALGVTGADGIVLATDGIFTTVLKRNAIITAEGLEAEFGSAQDISTLPASILVRDGQTYADVV